VSVVDGPDGSFSIGELARRTGLAVKTVRFYSDTGLVPPTSRSAAGHRHYDTEALARLELVRTLRELGVDLATIRRVLAREITLADVAALHAEALDVQIRTLRLRRSVLRVMSTRDPTAEEMDLMNRLARLSDEERQRLIDDYLDETFAGLDLDPEFAARMRAGRPQLPDDPSPEQLEAWVELAELVQDPDFRRSTRQMAEHQAAGRGAGGTHQDDLPWQQISEVVTERAGAAVAGGVDPASLAARHVVAQVLAAAGQPDEAAQRHRLADRIASGADPRAERYWQLLAVINGWPPIPTAMPAWAWLVAALRTG
jgi:DNA-binding transcriptional MerR regulator